MINVELHPQRVWKAREERSGSFIWHSLSARDGRTCERAWTGIDGDEVHMSLSSCLTKLNANGQAPTRVPVCRSLPAWPRKWQDLMDYWANRCLIWNANISEGRGQTLRNGGFSNTQWLWWELIKYSFNFKTSDLCRTKLKTMAPCANSHFWNTSNHIVIADIVHAACEYTEECIISVLHGNNGAQVAGVSIILFRKCV